MASFQKVIERSHCQVTSLKASVNNIFQAVSAHRFRDVAPEIRTLVIEGIAHWTSSLPADFLQDQYLKYVAWALSDRVCNFNRSLTPTTLDTSTVTTASKPAFVVTTSQLIYLLVQSFTHPSSSSLHHSSRICRSSIHSYRLLVWILARYVCTAMSRLQAM